MSDYKKSLDIFKKETDKITKNSMEKPIKWPPEKTGARREWTAHGLRCCTVMGAIGICGYVRVPDSHPVAEKDYTDMDIEVHGGLTFRCKGDDGGHWFGFDTGHFDDGSHPESKVYGETGNMLGSNYWDDIRVEHETEFLARQLSEIK